jgi:hypothetical protein
MIGRPVVRASGLLAGLTLMLMASANPAFADHPTGGLVTPPEIKQSIPQAPVFRDFLPQAVDLSAYMPPVGDQGDQGSCVGWATAYAARAYYAEQVEHRDTKTPQNQPSPAFVYDLIHQGDSTCDGGSRIPDAMGVLQQGAYSLADFPYSDKSCARPDATKVSAADDFKIKGYTQVYDAQGDRDLDKVKGALAVGEPVVTLVILDRAFQHLGPANTVWISDMYAPSSGGHAITLVGYDDRSGVFKFINSWGTGWGDDGYGYMTYDTFTARAAEAYVMTLPGDPEVTLADADLNPAPVNVPPPSKPQSAIVSSLTSLRDIDQSAAALPDLGDLGCGKVDITIDAQGNRIASGFVGTQDQLDRLSRLLDGQIEKNEITLAPWPACELRLTLDASLSDSDTPHASVDPAAPHVGNNVRIGIQSPGFASYLYAAFFSPDGTVTMLMQPDANSLRAKPPHSAIAFGDPGSGGMQLTVAPPVGDETLVVLASEKPLFDRALASSVASRAFLSDLRTALRGGDAGRVTAALVPVVSAP